MVLFLCTDGILELWYDFIMKKPESICIFGDSTAWGAWDIITPRQVHRGKASVVSNTGD